MNRNVSRGGLVPPHEGVGWAHGCGTRQQGGQGRLLPPTRVTRNRSSEVTAPGSCNAAFMSLGMSQQLQPKAI